jgi:thiol-disulfide isomerase/thioredoxin
MAPPVFPKPKTPDGIPRRFALIINGDPEEARHFENVERAVQTLKSEDPDYHIAVASSRPPKTPVAAYLPPNAQNLKALIRGLAREADGDDLFLFYVTGHGNEGKDKKGCVALPDGCLDHSTLAGDIQTISYGQRIVIMDDCYSGGAVSLFSDEKSTVITAGSPGEQVSCQSFSPYLWDEKVPDPNGDGVVTLAERYRFALKKGHPLTFSHYFAPQGSVSLTGSPEKRPPFPSEVLRVRTGEELRQTLRHLKPGQLALVFFSAEWCGPCDLYRSHFIELAKQYRGQFLMLEAEGVKNGPGQEENTWRDWEAWGVGGTFPSVAFLDHRGGILPVRRDYMRAPAKFLLKFPVLNLTEEQRQTTLLQMALEVPSIGRLDRLLLNPGSDLSLREKIHASLERVSQDKYYHLLQYLLIRLTHPKALVRSRAALCLGVLEEEDPRGLSALLKLTQDPDPMVRLESVLALLKIGRPKRVDQGSVELPGGYQIHYSRERDWLAAIPRDDLKKKLAHLRRHPDMIVRQGALFAQQLTLNEHDRDYPARAAALYLELLKDPALPNRIQGLGNFFLTTERYKGYFDYEKIRPFVTQIADHLKKDSELLAELGNFLKMTSDKNYSLIPEIVILILVETGDHPPEILEKIRLAQQNATMPERKKILGELYRELEVRGNYLGLSLLFSTPVTGPQGLAPGGGTQIHHAYRGSGFFGWRNQAGLIWNHSPAVDGTDMRIETITGPLFHLPRGLADGRLDLYFSFQAGVFHLFEGEKTGFTNLNGLGLQVHLSDRLLLDAAGQMALDIPGKGSVQLSARVPVGITYHFE